MEPHSGAARADAAWIASGGTTAAPRRLVISQQAARAVAVALAQRIHLTAADRWLLPLALDHVAGMAVVWRAMATGCAIGLADSTLDADALAGVTVASVVATQLHRLVAAGITPPQGFRLLLTGGSALPPGLADAALKLGWPIAHTYALSEAAGTVCCPAPTEAALSARAGTCGRPLPGITVTVLDDEGCPLPHGSVGRICLQGPTLARAQVVAGTWLPISETRVLTSDRGFLHDNGEVMICGRVDDVIVTGGVKVDPAHIEAAIFLPPSVTEILVISRPDPEWGERLGALVLPALGADPAQAVADLEQVSQTLPGPWRPRWWQVVTHIPRTPLGKPDRKVARAGLMAEHHVQ